MRRLRRGGVYLRVADPSWDDPLDASHAASAGGRWNPPGSFPVVYLNRDVRVARANVARKFHGRPYGPESLRADEAPILVHATITEDDYVDVVTDAGCLAVGLPVTYPRDGRGRVIGWARCQPVGQEAWDAGEQGMACRSAARGAPVGGEELAWLARSDRLPLRQERRQRFDEWFWG